MVRELCPEETDRAAAYALWIKAPNPMVTLFKTFDVTNLIGISKGRHLKFNMLMDYCIGKTASSVKEFYLLPVGVRLMQYDAIAVNTIVMNRKGGVNSCDLFFSEDLGAFNAEYLEHTSETANSCTDRDLSADNMVIGTSAIVDTEIDGVVNMYSGINNPMMIWGKYTKQRDRFYLKLSFQFHHTQMDGAHAGRFLDKLQREMNVLG